MRQTKDFEGARIDRRERTSFAGSSGVLLSGTHVVPNGSTKRFVQYMAIGDNGRFIRMIVSADERTFKDLEPSIDAIARSIAFRTSAPGRQ